MRINGCESHGRSLAKALTWRALGSIDTFLLGLLFTGNPGAAGAIASTEVMTKLLLYYGHERGWSFVRWGIDPQPTAPPVVVRAD